MRPAKPTPREIARSTAAQSAADRDAAGARARLAARLGFDCRTGGRRLGELTVDPCGDGSAEVLLSIDTTVVTIRQAQAIRRILVDGAP